MNEGLGLTDLIEGDIAGLEEDSGDGNKFYNAVNSEEKLWRGGVVPYTISDAFSMHKPFY